MLSATTKMKSLKVMAFALAVSVMPGFVQAEDLSTVRIAGTWEGTIKLLERRDIVSPTSIIISPAGPGHLAGRVSWQIGNAVCEFRLFFHTLQNGSHSFKLQKEATSLHGVCLPTDGGMLNMMVRERDARWVVHNKEGRPEHHGFVKWVSP